jgi:peptidoglycan/LPS O-acetylase OafA/YrhL
MYALLLAAVRWQHTVAAGRWTLALGGLTYPLYLLHQNIGYIAIDAMAPSTGRWPAAILTTAALLAASWVVWRFVEPPLQRALRAVLMPLAERTASVLRLRFGGNLPMPTS